MGLIQLEEMEFYAYHGHYREEQVIGNRFLLDLSLESDMEAPGRSDELKDAVNYQEVYRLINREMQKPSHLLEHVATRILDALFAELPGIRHATLKISKMNPPLGGKTRSVSVTLSR